MLKMLHGPLDNQQSEVSSVRMADAAWPVPFRPGLEYNSAAHGTWNIVHTGMLIPDAHQIYVCADNCNRGVVLTAVEMNARHRFSSVALRPEDFYSGQMEDKVIEGVGEIIRKLPRKPSVILLFLVCVHHFMGCDIPYIYESLRKNHPDQLFMECWMDPVMQKEGATPDEKLRTEMYARIQELPPDPKAVSFVGSDFPLLPDSDLISLLGQGGYQIRDITLCDSFEEYLSMGESSLFLCTYPPGLRGARQLATRLGRDLLYLPLTFDYEENDRQLALVCEKLSLKIPDTEILRRKCEEALKMTRDMLGETPVAIDLSAVPRPLSLARLLISHDIRVSTIFTDAFSREEEKDYHWLRDHAPDLTISSVIHPAMRRFHPDPGQEIPLAIGQKAAYFYRTGHFVNLVQGGGLHGYSGILEMLRLIREAFLQEKDPQDLIVRKGLGCESCL